MLRRNFLHKDSRFRTHRFTHAPNIISQFFNFFIPHANGYRTYKSYKV